MAKIKKEIITAELIGKFCKLVNKHTFCRRTISCHFCPFFYFTEVLKRMQKGESLGHAVNKVLETPNISKAERDGVIKEALERGRK